jgi:hypothetical protein
MELLVLATVLAAMVQMVTQQPILAAVAAAQAEMLLIRTMVALVYQIVSPVHLSITHVVVAAVVREVMPAVPVLALGQQPMVMEMPLVLIEEVAVVALIVPLPQLMLAAMEDQGLFTSDTLFQLPPPPYP